MVVDLLKSAELRLLRCTLSSPSSSSNPNPHPHPLIEPLVASIERGDYAAALNSPASKLVVTFADSFCPAASLESADQFYAELERSVDSFLRGSKSRSSASEAWLDVLDSMEGGDGGHDEEGGSGNEMEVELRFTIVMCLGVAALLAFAQQNVTGPVGVFSPFPVSFFELKKDNIGGKWDVWAQNQLMSIGCGLLGKFSHLQYIVYAKILLSKAKDFSVEKRDYCLSCTRTISWWLFRLILLQQRILDELSSSLYDLLQVYKMEILRHFSKLDFIINYWGSTLREGEASTIVSMAQLEAGIMEHKFGRVDSSNLHLERADEACGLQLSITGVLGFRTIHQVNATAQRVLVPYTDGQVNGGEKSTDSPHTAIDISACEDKMKENKDYECSDILRRPRLVESDGGTNENISGNGKEIKLTTAQQAVILAHCLHLKRKSRNDELSMWDMAPYIEAIDGQHHSQYAIRCLCDTLRIRWESMRGRTKERALLMMDKLVEAVKEDIPTPVGRIQFSFGVYLPTIPALRKEYGELLVSCGMIGEALKIFEDLELWDNLIYCYRLLDKKSAAVDLIKARLVDVPNDSRLWCSLGDVTNTDAYYEKALEVSNNRSARAKRSLARSAYNRGDYERSKILWESAMAINSLFPDGWFALGAAALKPNGNPGFAPDNLARDFDKALDGYTRAVQVDPDNGEAWNNIAFLHMRNKKTKAAFVAFKQALKYRRNTWQLWENYSHVALELGNFYQALEATKQVLDLSKYKQVDVELLDTIMKVIEESASKTSVSSSLDAEGPQTYSCIPRSDLPEEPGFSSEDLDSDDSMTDISETSGYLEPTILQPRESELLMDMLGTILAQVVRNGGGGDIWVLYARWHKMKGNLTMCSEALLKQVRSYQGADLWHDRDRFKKFAYASLQLCKVYMEIASSTASHCELMTAEMHLRNSVKQAVNFLGTEEFQELQACHEEVKKLLSATSNGA